MKRFIVLTTTLVLMTMGWFTANAMAFAHTPIPHPQRPGALVSNQYEWCDGYDFLCAHDLNGGGIGAVVVQHLDDSHESFDWILQSNGKCGGSVTSTCPGGWISNNLVGLSFVTLKNVGGSNNNGVDLCMNADNHTNWFEQMQKCDGFQGGSYPGTIMVYQPGKNDCDNNGPGVRFWSYQWNANGNTNGASLNILPFEVSGDPDFMAAGVTLGCNNLWYPSIS